MAEKKYYGLDGYDPDVDRWLKRAAAMKTRRSFFEEMWRTNIYAFVAHAIYDEGYSKRQFDPSIAPELQGYFNTKLSSLGFRFSDIRYPLEFAVIMRKMAVEIKNIPQPDWKVEYEDDQSPALLFKSVYNDILYNQTDSEYEDFEGWLCKNVFGTSIYWSRMVEYPNTISIPIKEGKDGEWEYEKKTKNVKKFKYSNIDLRHVLLDEGCTKPTLEDCDDAIVFEYFSEDKADAMLDEEILKRLNVKPCKRSEAFQDVNDRAGGDTKLVYEFMNCYNKRKDEWTRIINGKKYKTSPIPMNDERGEKDIPLSLLIDHKVPGQPYGYGEPTIIRPFREIKNKNRNLIYDVTKKTAKPTITVDPMSTFNEDEYMFGQDILRVAPSDFGTIPVTANLQPAIDLDKITDNDTIVTTGVNILDASAAPSEEKATKTLQRRESQVAVIDLGMNLNTAVGLKRLHKINANIILLNLRIPKFDKDDKQTVTTEGSKIFKNQTKNTKLPKFFSEKKHGSHTFEYKGEDLEYRFTPVVKMGNIALTETLKNGIEMEGLNSVAQVAPNVYDQRVAGKILVDMYNFPKELIPEEQSTAGQIQPSQSPEDSANQIARKAGAILPEEIALKNQAKNAQQDQTMAEDAQRADAMGGGGAPNGVPPPGNV